MSVEGVNSQHFVFRFTPGARTGKWVFKGSDAECAAYVLAQNDRDSYEIYSVLDFPPHDLPFVGELTPMENNDE